MEQRRSANRRERHRRERRDRERERERSDRSRGDRNVQRRPENREERRAERPSENREPPQIIQIMIPVRTHTRTQMRSYSFWAIFTQNYLSMFSVSGSGNDARHPIPTTASNVPAIHAKAIRSILAAKTHDASKFPIRWTNATIPSTPFRRSCTAVDVPNAISAKSIPHKSTRSAIEFFRLKLFSKGLDRCNKVDVNERMMALI